MKKIHYLYTIVFIAAFLLFQIELIIAKMFLPIFGGMHLVWAACITFFQCILLLGYYYSHLVIKRFGIYRYRIFHIFVIVLSLVTLPVLLSKNINASLPIPAVFNVFLQLLIKVGPVFFVLSTISVLAQTWLAASPLPQRSNPYPLYAISNVGSLLALLTYPFFFEVFLDTRVQLYTWSFLYACLACTYLLAFKYIGCEKTPVKKEKLFNLSFLQTQFTFTEVAKDKIKWLALSASASVLFLSVTNIFTYRIAPCPLLWIIPLSIFLISFILAFQDKPFHVTYFKNNIYTHIGIAAVIFFLTGSSKIPVLFYIAAYSYITFCICLFCQQELYASRPRATEGLTAFYLVIALGGFLGSAFITWTAPLIFIALPFEYLVGLLFVPLALLLKDAGRVPKKSEWRWTLYLALFIAAWPFIFTRYNIIGYALAFFFFKTIFGRLKGNNVLVCLNILLCIVLMSVTAGIKKSPTEENISVTRNYYGIYHVKFDKSVFLLIHGNIIHGAQFVDKNLEREPLTYFHRGSAIGKVLESDAFRFKHIGIVGLGAGTLAAYGTASQTIDFFEIDPAMHKIATLFFRYLKNSKATINHIFGDARLQIAKEPPAKYDALIVDAFSGDSVPIHLLSVEALGEYKKHLHNDSVVFFHLSNRYLRLVNLVFSNALAVGAYPSLGIAPAISDVHLESTWVAITWNKQTHDILTSRLHWKQYGEQGADIKKVRPWTDYYSNTLTVIDWVSILDEIRNFKILEF